MGEMIERARIALAVLLVRLAIRVHPQVLRRALKLFVAHINGDGARR